jgi:hypothetical protein
MPLEKALKLLPDKWAEVINGATRKSLETALAGRAADGYDKPQPNSWEFLHKLAVRGDRRRGGALGLPGLPLDRADPMYVPISREKGGGLLDFRLRLSMSGRWMKGVLFMRMTRTINVCLISDSTN